MKKEKKELTSDNALVKAFEVSLNYMEESDKLYMKSLSIRADLLSKQIKSKYADEPPKLFKKMHKKWQDELDKLEDELMVIYKKVGEEIKYKMDFYEKLKSI